MALDKPTLVVDLQVIFDYEATQETNPDQSRIRVAQKIADAIDKYVKTGLVSVTTIGTSSAQHGTGNIT